MEWQIGDGVAELFTLVMALAILSVGWQLFRAVVALAMGALAAPHIARLTLEVPRAHWHQRIDIFSVTALNGAPCRPSGLWLPKSHPPSRAPESARTRARGLRRGPSNEIVRTRTIL